jgi:hypothetical protein
MTTSSTISSKSELRLQGLAALALCTACVQQGELLGPPYEVMVLDRIPGATTFEAPSPVGAQFALQQRSLETIEDFERLASPNFRILQGGTLTADAVDGDTVSGGSFVGGSPPALRYTVEGGVAVPRDYPTLLMFSAAYQFEQMFAGLGLATSPVTRAALEAHGVMDAIFGPTISGRQDGVEVSFRERSNAFFFPQGWQFGLAGSSPDERAPFAADGWIIAHELGHAVFQQALFDGKVSGCDATVAEQNERDPRFEGRLERELAIRGLNEGFADWISFAVTGGNDPIASIDAPPDDSVDVNVAERLLTEDNFRWSQIAKPDDVDPSAETRCRGKYCVGTLFARSLVASYLGAGHDPADAAARQEFSRGVVGALEGTLTALEELELPLPEPGVARCGVRDDVFLAWDPPLIGAFLQAFLPGIPEETRPLLCSELVDRFEDGFPVQFRKECE